MNPKLTAVLIVSVTVAVVALAVSSVYSAYVASQNRKNSCNSRALVLDVLHDVIVDATTPRPGQVLTRKQAIAIATFQAKAFTRIDQARC